MNLDRYVQVSIARSLATVSRRGFGNIMLAGYHTAWLDRVRTYSSSAQMVTDGISVTHPLVIAAQALEGQSPRVPSWKVGRRVGAPTQIVRLTPLLTTQGTVYSGTLNGLAWTYTVPASTPLATICTAIAAAITALAQPVTATGASGTFVDVTGDVPGGRASYGFTSLVDVLTVEDRTVEPATTLATDLAAMKAADADWYGLVVTDAHSKAQIDAVAAWAATQVLIYVAHTMDSIVEAASSADVASNAKTLLRERTVMFYSRLNHGRQAAAALIGKVFALSFGVEFAFPTWTIKSIAGLATDPLSDTVLERLIGTPISPTSGKNAFVYTDAVPTGANGATPITAGGMTSGGLFIDDLQGIDYLTSRLQESAFNLQLGRAKVPFTEAGIDTLVGAVRGVLRTMSIAPYNLIRPTFTVEPTLLSATTVGDRAARYYNGVSFGANTQGAINSIRIAGNVAP